MSKRLRKRIFFMMFALIFICGGCTNQKGNSDDISQTQIEEGQTEKETPVDIYEFQEEEE